MAVAMAMAKKQKNGSWRKLRHKQKGWLLLFWVGCVCTMGVLYGHWALYNPKTPKCALTCQADLAADPWFGGVGVRRRNTVK
jgi:hypothetical protein